MGLTKVELKGLNDGFDNALRRDLSVLALHTGVSTNKSAYNLNDAFIDQFEDTTGIASSSQVSVSSPSGADDYISTFAETSHSSDSNTDLLILSNTTDGSTTFADSGPDTHGISSYGSIAHQTEGGSGRGSSAIGLLSNGQYLRTTNTVADLNLCDKSNNWTLEFWLRTSGTPSYNYLFNYGQFENSAIWRVQWNSGNVELDLRSATNWSWSGANSYVIGTTLAEDTWYHLAWSNSGGTLKCFVNGALTATYTSVDHSASATKYLYIGSYYGSGTYNTGRDYYMDNIRISDNARYTAAFVPESTIHSSGNFISDASTASDARTKVSGVMLYKDEHGTATLGTDLKVYFSCNNGTNWTALDSTSGNYTVGPNFSTGIKTVMLKEVTCTSGTSIKYKVEWANQSSGSKETRLYGIGMNY